MTSAGEDREGGNAESQGQAGKAPAFPPYRSYKCRNCGHAGTDADPHIDHTSIGIVCLKCGAKITD